jgi:hypothetical protein
MRVQLRQLGMGDHGAVRLAAQQPIAGDEQQPPVGQPVDTAGDGGRAADDLAGAAGVKRDQLVRGPVGNPEPAIVPPWRFAENQPIQDHFRVHAQPPSGEDPH